MVTTIVVILATLFALTVRPRSVVAHAFLEESNPAANDIIATVPETITLRFTEPLERSYSKAELFDQTGAVVDDAPSRFGDDRFAMIIDPAGDLADGTYSVLWRTLSEADGHTAQGYMSFTIGTADDVEIVIPPATTETAGGPPAWLQAISRWLPLLGIAATIAAWPIWLFVLRPALTPVGRAGPTLARRTRGVAFVAIGFALAGNVLALIVQAAGVAGDAGLGRGLVTTIGETRYGQLWLFRVGLLLIFGSVLVAVSWWRPWRRPVPTAAGLLVAAALPVPFSLLSHASAQPAGRTVAIAVDALHLLAASVWAGGLLVLVGGLLPVLRQLSPRERRSTLAVLIPRFSAVALIGWGVMGLTGFYSAWLQVGNLTALTETPYGQSLIIKLVLLIPLLALGAFNLLVVTKRLRHTAGDQLARFWSRRFTAAIVTEAVLIVVVLLVVGRLIGQAPAREALAQEAGQVVIPLDADGQQATLAIIPGATGPNHYRLELPSGTLATSASEPAEAVLRVELASQETGQKEIEMTRAAGDVFEGHGSELSIAGDWSIETILRQPGEDDWGATTIQAIATTPPDASLPGPPWRFDTMGLPGLALLVGGVGGIVLAWQAGRSAMRKEGFGLGLASLAIGAILLLQARVDPEEQDLALAADVPDAAAVTRGEALFGANCVSCHGPAGQGDGPAAANLDPAPATLTDPHARAHRDEDLLFWITSGIEGSAMPGFGDQLSEQEIRDVLAYLRALQADPAIAQVPPSPTDCQIEPRTLESMQALAAEPDTRPSTPVDSPGAAADDQTVAEITATMRELVACSNANDTLRRLALFSDANLRAAFPEGPTPAFTSLVATPPVPVPEAERVDLLSVGEARVFPDGRVQVLATIDNPLTHSHGPDGAETADHQDDEQARLTFVQSGDRWLIDQVQR